MLANSSVSYCTPATLARVEMYMGEGIRDRDEGKADKRRTRGEDLKGE